MPVEDLLREAHDPALVVVLDGVEDPRNLGAILRSAEAAGADGVLLPDRHSAGLSETVVARLGGRPRAREGGADRQRGPGHREPEGARVLGRGLRRRGARALGRRRLQAAVAVVLGGEGKGIRRLVRERCDHLVSLPLFGHVTSLNVSVVAGIALYEVVRQRGVAPSHVRPIPPQAPPAPRGDRRTGSRRQGARPRAHLHAPAHHAPPRTTRQTNARRRRRRGSAGDRPPRRRGGVGRSDVVKADDATRPARGRAQRQASRRAARPHETARAAAARRPAEAGPEGPRSSRRPGPAGPGADGGRRRRGRGRGRGGQPAPAPASRRGSRQGLHGRRRAEARPPRRRRARRRDSAAGAAAGVEVD